MYSKVDVLSDKKETAKSFRAFLESKEVKKNGVDVNMIEVLLGEFEELISLSQGFYDSALKNIAEKAVIRNRLEIIEDLSRDFGYGVEILG